MTSAFTTVEVLPGSVRSSWTDRLLLGDDRPWLLAVACFTAIELGWWLVAWRAGIAPAPRIAAYLLIASIGLAIACGVRILAGLRPIGATPPAAIVATLLAGVAASLFLPLKYAIPSEIPFWLDKPLAVAERSLLGADPWLLLDRTFGMVAVPMDWLYGCWLPVQSVVFFLVVLSRPTPAKTRSLIAYGAAWFLLGVVAAVVFASAGPIFYDRLLGSQDFAQLEPTLRARGVWIAIAESDRMWVSFESGHPGVVAGISAVPSIHVAVSLWAYLAARALAPRFAPLAFAYFLLIWLGSVQLGWHYVSDGLAGVAGMLAIWKIAGLTRAIPAAGPRAASTEES